MSHASQDQFLAAIIVPTIGPSLFVAIRIVNNYGLRKRFLADDWLSLVGLAFLFATGILYYMTRAVGGNSSESFEAKGRLFIAVTFVSSFGAYFAKLPILILYLRLFGVYTSVRITVYTLFIVPFIILSGSASYMAALCSPDGPERVAAHVGANAVFRAGCMRSGLVVCLWNGAVALAADIVIFVLPLPVISTLRLPVGKKIGVVVVFMSGSVGIIASLVALYYRSISVASDGKSGNNVAEMLGPVIECSVAVMVGSIPAVSCFWRTRIAKSPFYHKVTSTFRFANTIMRSWSRRSQPLPIQGDASSSSCERTYNYYPKFGGGMESTQNSTEATFIVLTVPEMIKLYK